MDVGGVSGEISVHPTRLVFTPENWVKQGTGQTVSVYAGEDFDADNDMATLTHTVSGGDYTNESRGIGSGNGHGQRRTTRGITASPIQYVGYRRRHQ